MTQRAAKAAIGLAVCVFALLIVVIISLLIQQARNNQDQRNLRAEALGLCYAIDSDRGIVDVAHRIIATQLNLAGHYQTQTGQALAHGISPATHQAAQIQQRLGRTSLRSAHEVELVGQIDCETLTAHPLGYQFPAPTPVLPPNGG